MRGRPPAPTVNGRRIHTCSLRLRRQQTHTTLPHRPVVRSALCWLTAGLGLQAAGLLGRSPVARGLLSPSLSDKQPTDTRTRPRTSATSRQVLGSSTLPKPTSTQSSGQRQDPLLQRIQQPLRGPPGHVGQPRMQPGWGKGIFLANTSRLTGLRNLAICPWLLPVLTQQTQQQVLAC